MPAYRLHLPQHFQLRYWPEYLLGHCYFVGSSNDAGAVDSGDAFVNQPFILQCDNSKSSCFVTILKYTVAPSPPF